jgi:type IV secretion system protein VirB4
MNWTGAAKWLKREARAGDRLPFDRHIDDATIRLRDGALMRTLHIGGMEFETQDSEQLDHAQAVREVLLRSVLDARFVVYHHVVRRSVSVASGGEFESPFCAAIAERWDERLAERSLFVNEQFLTIVRRPARGKTGWPERLQRRFGRSAGDDLNALRDLEAATGALLAGLESYGARLLSCYNEKSGKLSEPLEFLSSIYNGEMRPVVLPEAGADLGHHIPYRRVSFGLDAIEIAGAGGRSFAGMLSIKEYPAETRPGLVDDILRLPHELVLTETFTPTDRQIARERIDLALRRQKAGEEDSGTERREMLAARDARPAVAR